MFYIVCIMGYMAFKWFYIAFVYGCLLFLIRVHMVFIRLCMDIKIYMFLYLYNVFWFV